MNRSETELSAVMSRVLRPRERLMPDEWADRYRVLPSEGNKESGAFRTDRTPYTRGPLRDFADPEVDEITLAFASQTGKTSAVESMLGWVADMDPAPVMYMWPNEDVAARFNTKRFTPSVRESPRLRSLLGSTAAKDLKTLEVNFQSCSFYFVGSGSDAQSRGISIKHIFADDLEAAEFDQEKIEDLRQRRNAWPGGKFVKISIPGMAMRGIDRELSMSRVHRYWVPCPHCVQFQPLRWTQVKWDGGASTKNADRARATAFYCCEHCGAAIHDHDKGWMVERGVWVAEGQRIERQQGSGGDGERGSGEEAISSAPMLLGSSALPPEHIRGLTLLDGYAIVGVAEKASRRSVGYTLSALYSPWVTFGDLAYGWCRQGGAPEQKWINGNLAEAWQPAGDKIDRDAVMKLCLRVPEAKVEGAAAEKMARRAGAYRLGEIPPGVLVITGAIDLQRDRAYAEIVGWGEHCREAWLLWFATAACPHGDDVASFRALEELVGLRLPMDDPLGPRSLGASRWVIDSGDGVRTKDVYRFARMHPGRVMACKGRPGDMVLPAKKVALDKYPDGTPIVGGLTLFEVNTWKYKGQMLGKLKQRPIEMVQEAGVSTELDEAVREEMGGAGGGRWWFPDPDRDVLGRPVREAMVEYFDQLTAEQLAPLNPRDIEKGRPAKYGWVRRPGRVHNHFGDCRVYNQAVAEHEFGSITRAHMEALAKGAAARSGAPATKSRGRDGLDGIRDRWRGVR